MSAHILDRPVWATLNGRQADLAVRHGPAIRMQPDYGLFAAIPDNSSESLAAVGELVRGMDADCLLYTSPSPRDS